jgi:hypothetical protein
MGYSPMRSQNTVLHSVPVMAPGGAARSSVNVIGSIKNLFVLTLAWLASKEHERG